MTNFKINIVSDTTCPWCYVGKKRLEKGIAAYKAKHPERQDTFTTTWMPYYLNPDRSRTGIPIKPYWATRYGEQRASMIFERLLGVGKEEGIEFNFDGKTGSTRKSHRLIALAKSKGEDMQFQLVDEFFKAYFEEGQDISDVKVLKEASVKAGLDEQEVQELLDGERFGEEVDKEVEHAQGSLVSGVPNYTIQGTYDVSGAQEPTAFVHLFERVAKMENL